MSARTRLVRSLAITFGLAVFAMTTGCTQALNSGLAMVGVDRNEFSNPFGNWSRAKSGGQFTTGYESAPTLDLWTGVSIGQPYSVAYSVSNSLNGMSPSRPINCQIFPMGLARVLPIAGGATGTPLHSYDGINVGIAGNLGPPRSLFSGDGLRFAQQALGASSQLGTANSQCGQSLFMYVQLGSGLGAPVSALR